MNSDSTEHKYVVKHPMEKHRARTMQILPVCTRTCVHTHPLRKVSPMAMHVLFAALA